MWLARNVIDSKGNWQDYLEILYKNFVIRVSTKIYNLKYFIKPPVMEEQQPRYEQLTLF